MTGFLLFMAWPLIITSGAIAAGVFLKGANDALAHWDMIQTKRERLEYLREAARDEALHKEVSQTWNKGSDWND